MYKTKKDILGLIIQSGGTKYKLLDHKDENLIRIDYVTTKGTANSDYTLKSAIININKDRWTVVSKPSKIHELW